MKRIITISIVLFGLTFTSLAQNKPASGLDPAVKFLKVYPIPATTVVSFEFERGYDKSYSFQVYNFMGKKIEEIKAPNQLIILSLNEYYRGVYIYQLRDRNGKMIESGRFQVVK